MQVPTQQSKLLDLLTIKLSDKLQQELKIPSRLRVPFSKIVEGEILLNESEKISQNQFSKTPIDLPSVNTLLKNSISGQKLINDLYSFAKPAELQKGNFDLVKDIRSFLTKQLDVYLLQSKPLKQLDSIITDVKNLQKKVSNNLDNSFNTSFKTILATSTDINIPIKEIVNTVLQMQPDELDTELSKSSPILLKNIANALEAEFLKQASPDLKDAYTKLTKLIFDNSPDDVKLLKTIGVLLERQPQLRAIEKTLRRVLILVNKSIKTKSITSGILKNIDKFTQNKIQYKTDLLLDTLMSLPEVDIPKTLETFMPLLPKQQFGLLAQLLGLSLKRESNLINDDSAIQLIKDAMTELDVLDDEIVTRKLQSLFLSTDDKTLDFIFPFDKQIHRALITRHKSQGSSKIDDIPRWSIHLSLPKLGHIRVELTTSNKFLQIGFNCSMQETVEFLKNNRQELECKLQRLGFVSRISYCFDDSYEQSNKMSSTMDLQA